MDPEEFTAAFGKVLGKGLNKKQLNQLFMRIDADSNGDVGKYFMSFVNKWSRLEWVYALHVDWK